MKNLKNNLKNKIDNCYLLQGEDYYLYERAFGMIKKAVNLQLDDFNLQIFDDDNFSLQQVLDSCEVLPMGSDFRIVVLKNISKISEKDKKCIENYVNNCVKSTILIIFDYFNKFLNFKNATFISCKRFDKLTASSVILNEFKKRNKKISQEAIDTLLEYCDGYLTRIMNEIDKLCFYNLDEQLVTKKIVDQMVTKDDDYVVFELTEALGKKNNDLALKILSSIVKEQGVLGMIINHFRRLFFISISGLENKELAELLSVKEYAIKKQREQLLNFSKIQLKKIYSLLEEIDFKIKNGEMLQETALYYLVISILYI